VSRGEDKSAQPQRGGRNQPHGGHVTKKLKGVPAPFPQEHLDSMKQHDAANWETLRKLVHPDGDAIELDIIDGEFVDLTVKQGPHEICRLAFTGPELDVLVDRLQRARRKVKP
jgi:hypothetical protein